MEWLICLLISPSFIILWSKILKAMWNITIYKHIENLWHVALMAAKYLELHDCCFLSSFRFFYYHSQGNLKFLHVCFSRFLLLLESKAKPGLILVNSELWEYFCLHLRIWGYLSIQEMYFSEIYRNKKETSPFVPLQILMRFLHLDP